MKNNKLKVLHVLPTLKKDGAEVQLSELFKKVKNINIHLFTFDLYEQGDSIANNLKEIPIFYKSNLSINFLYKLINENQYDIVHSHLPKSDLIVGLLRMFSKRKFSHVISVHAQYGTREGESKFKYFFTNNIWKYILNNSDGVIAISNKIKNWLVVDKKINSKKIDTIHYGVEMKTRNVVEKESLTIGMAARILPWKGWDRVLEVAYSLSKKNINFKLLLAGSDDEGYLSTIKKLISDYNLSDIVDIRNHYKNIDDFFEELDLFLFLSSSEGFGLVVLEAIENNVTVICSDISPLNEFVNGTEGSLVNRENTEHIADLVEKYASDNKFLLKKVQKEQKQFVIDNFSIEISADKIEKFYINTINV